MTSKAAPARVSGQRGRLRASSLRGVIALVAVILATAAVWLVDVEADTGLPVGAHDHVAFWAAFDVGVDGGDPYDEPTLRAVEADVHPRYEAAAQRFWSPPWTLIALAPVLVLPFELSVASWLVLHAVGALACVALSWRLFVSAERGPPLAVVLLSVAFVPLVMDALFGQLGVLITVCILGGFVALRGGRDGLAGVLFALVILKPQLAFLPLALVAALVVFERRWRVVWSGAVTVVVLVGASWLAFPDAWSGWAPFGGEAGDFSSATVPSWLRDELPGRPTWPLVAVPAIAVVATFSWWWRTRPEIRWSAIPVVLALSVLFAPRAFVYDAVLLLPIQVRAVAAALRATPSLIPGVAAIAFQPFAWWIANEPGTAHHHLVFIPLGLLLIELLLRRDEDVASLSSTATPPSGRPEPSTVGTDP